MTDINSVNVTGRVVRDIGERDFTYFASGTAKLQFSIAVNKSAKDANGNWSEKSAFFDVVVWGKYAESLRPRLAKGAKVAVHGSLERDTWEDKQTRAKREKIYIKGENIQVLSTGQPQSLSSGQPALPSNNNGNNEAEFEDDWPDGVLPDSIPF